jgi:predicted hotdog family 3-hydroxylacyl-ACP dehydratase
VKSDFKQPTEAFLRGIDIHTLLPQQEPFVMVGCLIQIDEKSFATETLVKAENIFVDEGYLSASGLIENIAQTCAVRIGYVNKYILKKGIQIGFIGAIRNMEVIELPQVGDLIMTTVDVQEEVFGMTLAYATVTCGGKTLVNTEIKIAVKEG